jgi:uncharacterized membrane protein YccC
MGLRDLAASLVTEFRSLETSGPRAQEALEAALSVGLGVTAALYLHSDNPWWVAISAFRVTRASFSVALWQGGMRLAGSAAGAAAGVIAFSLFAENQPAFCFCLFAFAWAGLFGFAASRFNSAWMFFGVTSALIMLSALDQPDNAPMMAINRIIDVAIGGGASLIVAALLPEPRTDVSGVPVATATRPPPMPFWARRHREAVNRWLADNWALMRHATRGGLAVMLLPMLTTALAPLSPTQLGITAVAVMAVPTTAARDPSDRVVIERAMHRVVGCLIGAALGLIGLKLAGSDFLIWLVVIMAGTWLSSQIQSATSGIGYVGTQLGIAFLSTMIESEGPSVSISAGVGRFAGIVVGLSLLLLITVVMAVGRTRAEPKPG